MINELQIALLIACVISLLLDWSQTRFIAKNPDKFFEAWNLVLDRHPSVGSVNAYFGACILATMILAWAIPHPINLIVLTGIAVMELICIAHNRLLGIGFA